MSTILSASIGRDPYRTELRTDSHAFIGDEPASEGGGDLGPDPYEFVLAALATCTCATLRMYADRKGLPLEGVELRLEMAVEKDGATQVTRIQRQISLLGDLDDAARQSLLRIAEKCPVHKLLTNPVEISTSLA